MPVVGPFTLPNAGVSDGEEQLMEPGDTRNGLNRIRELAERWRTEGCRQFDTADAPVTVAEAAGKLLCALELFEAIDFSLQPRRTSEPHEERPERRTGQPDRRRQNQRA